MVGPPPQHHYTEQQMHEQDRSVERVNAYNQLDKQRNNFMTAPEPETSPIGYGSPSLQHSQPSFLSSTELRPKNRLTAQERNSLDKEQHRIRDFAKSEAAKNTPVVQFAMKKNKQAHTNLMEDPKFRKKYNYNSGPEDNLDSSSEESEMWDDGASEEDDAAER